MVRKNQGDKTQEPPQFGGFSMLRKVLIGLCLLFCQNVGAAEVKIFGAETPIPVNSFAELSVKVDPGDQVGWQVFPHPTKLSIGDSGGKLYASGPPGTKYTVF